MGAQPSNGRCERALTTESVFKKFCEKCSLSNNGEPTFWKTADGTIYEVSRLAPGFSEGFSKTAIPVNAGRNPHINTDDKHRR
jgi:hypothetical protein